MKSGGVSSDSDEGGGTRFLIQAVFQAGVLTGRYHHGHRTLMGASLVLELIQLLALILIASPIWSRPVIDFLNPILSLALLSSLFADWRLAAVLALGWGANLALVVWSVLVRIPMQWAIKTLRLLSALMTTALFVPVVHALVVTATASCAADCSVTASLLGRGVAVLALASVVVVGTIVTISNCEQALESTAPLARPHSRIELGYGIVYRTLFVTMTVMGGTRPLTAIVLVSISALTAFLFLRYLPYYRVEFVMLRTSALAILTWAAICLLIGDLQDDYTIGPTAALFVCSPILILSVMILIRVRIVQLRSLARDALPSCYELELQARLLLLDLLQERERRLALGGQYDLGAALAPVRALYDESSCARFRDSPMFFWFRARFMFEFDSNVYQGYTDLLSADQASPAPDIQFMIYRQRTLSMEQFCANYGARDIISYLIGEVHASQAFSLDLHSVNLQMSLWSELCKATPDLDSVPSLGLALRSATASAAYHYETAIKFKRTDQVVLARYLQFLLDTEGDSNTTVTAVRGRLDELHRAETEPDLSKKLDLSMSTQLSTNRIKQALYADHNAIVVVSLSDDQFGRIERANLQFSVMFGFADADALMGRPLELIMPEPFASAHPRIMRDRLRSNTHTLLDKSERVLIARHRSGALFRVSVLLRLFTERGARLSVLAVISPVRTPDNQIESVAMALVQASDGRLFGTSTAFGDLFGAGRSQSASQIASFIPDYDQHRDQMRQPEGYPLEIHQHQYRILIDTRLDYGLGVDLVLIEPIAAVRRDSMTNSFFATNTAFRHLLFPSRSETSSSATKQRTSSVSGNSEGSQHQDQWSESVTDAVSEEAASVTPMATEAVADEVRAQFLVNVEAVRRREQARRPPIGLVHIRLISIAFAVFVVVLVLVLVAYINSTVLDQFLARTGRIVESGTKRLAALTLIRAVHTLALVRDGILTPDRTVTVWDELRPSAETVRDVDGLLAYDAFHSSTQRPTLFGADLNVSEAVGDQYAGVVRNLFDLDLITVGRARRLDTSRNLTAHARDIDEMLRASFGDVGARLHDAVVLYRQEAASQVGLILDVARAVCSAIALITIMICGVILRPAVADIESVRNRIAAQFLKIPLSEVKSSLIRSAKRADNLRRAEAETESGPPRLGRATSVLAADPSRPDTTAARNEADLQALLLSARRRRASRVTRLTLRLAAPYAVVLALVVTLWYATYDPLTRALVSAPANLQISADRTYAARYVLLLLHVLATPGATSLKTTSIEVSEAIDQFLQLHRSLTYGSATPIVTGTVYEHSNQDTLLYGSACLAEFGSECATFASGALNSGLHTAVFDYADRCRIALGRIQSWCGAGTTPGQAGNCTQAVVQARILRAPELLELDQYDRLYLFPALRRSEAFYDESVSSAELIRLRQNAIVIIAVYAVLAVGVYGRLFRPTMGQVLEHGLQFRAMLAVLPDHVRLPGLEQLVNDHARKL